MTEATKQFIFSNVAEELYPLSMAVVEFLQQAGGVDEEALRTVKLVLMELLTNSLKHSGGQSIIEATVADSDIKLIRYDKGSPLAVNAGGLKLEWPLPGNHQGGRTIHLYSDHAGALQGRLANNRQVKFFIEETEPMETDMLTLPEHFGLMIITRACGSFEYEFDVDTCTNKFSATINL